MDRGDRLKDWILTRRLGRGAQGEVWLATDADGETQVALKVLDPVSGAAGEDWLGRLRGEAEALARVDHPAIVRLFEAHLEHTPPFLAMEWVEGESLRERVKRLGALGVGDALALATQVASALAHLHEHGVAHRDIKPENLMVVTDGPGESVKLVDFGISLQEGAARLTRPGKVLGSLPYLPPEALKSGASVVGEQQDLYGLGVVLYEALTGSDAFPLPAGASLDQQSLSVLQRKQELESLVLDPVCFGAPLRALVSDLTARSPHQRPSTARELLERIEQLGSEPRSSGPVDVEAVFTDLDGVTEELDLLPPPPAPPPPPPATPGPGPAVAPGLGATPLPEAPPPRRTLAVTGSLLVAASITAVVFLASSRSPEEGGQSEATRAEELAAQADAGKSSAGGDPPGSAEELEDPAPEPDAIDPPPPPVKKPPPPARPLGSVDRTGRPPKTITASTVLQSGCSVDGHRQDCSPTFLADGRGDTAWCEGVEGSGVGNWLELELAVTRKLHGLEIDNGYWKDSRTFGTNGRVTEVEITGDDGESIGTFDVGGDFGEPSRILFPQPVRSASLVVTLTGASPGSRYDDICISDLRVLLSSD